MISATFQKHYPPSQETDLALIDDCIKIEVLLLSLISGPQAVKPALERIVAAMPSAHRALKPESCLQLLTAIRASPTWKIAPRSSQALLTWTIQVVTSLVDGNPYELSKSEVHESA
eukprot:3198336-Lingulodinium_polyedra.AAC.1